MHDAAPATEPPSPAPQGWRARLFTFGRDWAVVVVLAAAGLWGFAKVGEDVFDHETRRFDLPIQAWFLAHQHPAAHRVFLVITTLLGTTGMFVLAGLAALYFWDRGRRHVAAGVLVAPVIAIVAFNIIKSLYARPRPAGLGTGVPSSYSFPSGHATASAAVFCTLAYVLWREGDIRGWPAVVIAIVAPLLIGVSRLYLNVHWATDVVGGWCAGVLVAVLSAALYNRYRYQSADRNLSVPPGTRATGRR